MMYRIQLIISLFIFLAFPYPDSVNAQIFTYDVQTIGNEYSTTTAGNAIAQSFTGVQGLPTEITLKVIDSGIGTNPTRHIIYRIDQCDDAAMTINCTSQFFDTEAERDESEVEFTLSSTLGTFITLQFPTTTTMILDSDRYFRVIVARRYGTDRVAYSGGSYSNPIPYSQQHLGEDNRFDIYTRIKTDQSVSLLNISEPKNTTSSTTVDIILDYNNTSGNYTNIVYKIISLYTFENLVQFLSIPLADVDGTYYASTTLETGNYRFEAYLYNGDTDTTLFPIQESDFTVVSSPIDDIFGADLSNYDNIVSLSTTTCSITNLSGCVQNALIFAFYPSEESLENFTNIRELVKNKPPFGYFNLLTNSIDDLTASSTPVFSLQQENNIQTNIFDPIRSGFVWLFWFMSGIFLYKRIKGIEL